MLGKEVSSTSFWVFGMTQTGIEPQSPGPFDNGSKCTSLHINTDKI